MPNSSRATSPKPTFDAFIAEVYLPGIKLTKRSWEYDARIARTHLSPLFGERLLGSISPHDVETWLAGLLESGLARTSCNRFLAVLKTIYKIAVMKGYIAEASSPCRHLQPLKTCNERSRYLSRAEAMNLMAYLRQHTRPEAAALQLLLLTGARKSEILKARWEDIDLEKRILTVPISKSGRPRHIVLSHAAMNIIQALPCIPGKSWLFPCPQRDQPLADIYVFWNATRTALGLKNVRIHDLRHTFASFLVNSGHSLYEVQRILGHSDPRTTMRYAHLALGVMHKAADTVSSMIIETK